MRTSLSCVGIVWTFLSVTASLLTCTGYYLPYWIQGKLMGQVDVYFGPFRRCNYPRNTVHGVPEIVQECGRYTGFNDIPSVWWQGTTVLVGIGCAFTILVAITLLSACCSIHIINPSTAKTAGILQLFAASLVACGGAIYPIGWDNRELKQSCENASAVYKLGSCQFSWSVYLLASAVFLLLLCFMLSFCSVRDSPAEPTGFRISGGYGGGGISTIS